MEIDEAFKACVANNLDKLKELVQSSNVLNRTV